MTDQERIEQLEQKVKALEEKVITKEQTTELFHSLWQEELHSATLPSSR
jgi:hypothetical protein